MRTIGECVTKIGSRLRLGILLTATALVQLACASTVETEPSSGEAVSAICGGTPTVAATPQNSTVVGSQVSFTVTPSCDLGDTPEYQLWVYPPGAGWIMAADWQDSNTFTWNAPAAGVYRFEPFVRAKGSTASRESVADFYYSVFEPGACTTVSATVSRNPGSTHAPVRITPVSNCANPQYQIWLDPPGDADWTLLTPYSTFTYFDWDTSTAALGTYRIEVDARLAGRTVSRESTTIFYQTIDRACTAVTGAVSSESAVIGSVVRLSGNATCDDGTTPEYRFYVQGPNSQQWEVVRDYQASNTYDWNTQGRTAGSYRVLVGVRHAGSTNTDPEAKTPTPSELGVTLGSAAPCTAVAASFSPGTGTVAAGTPVTITATPTCPPGVVPEYSFWTTHGDPSDVNSWVLLKGWSRDAFATLNGPAAGDYNLSVLIRAIGNEIDAYSNAVYTYTGTDASCQGTTTLCNGLCVETSADSLNCGACGNDCTATGQACSGGSCFTPICSTVEGQATPNPGAIDSTITLTGNATCTAGQAEYRFWMQRPGTSTWSLLHDFQPSNVHSWNTAGLVDGVYRIEIDARHAGSTGDRESVVIFDETLRSALYCSSVSAAFAPGSGSAAPGTPVTITASASGCSEGATPEFRYWVQAPQSTTWTPIQGWSASTTATFVGAIAGTYRVEVDVKAAGNSAVDAKTIPNFVYVGDAACPGGTTSCTSLCVNTNTDPQNCGACGTVCSAGQTCAAGSCVVPLCASVTGGASPASSAVGTRVTLTGNASCNVGAAEYRYWMQAPGSTEWISLSPFPTPSSFEWNTVGLTEGTYRIEVDARHTGSTGAVESKDIFYYTLQSPSACSSVAGDASPEQGIIGSPVTLTASATCGGGAAAEYRYWMRAQNATEWTLLSDFPTSASYEWNTSTLSEGTYLVQVDARHAGATGAAEAKDIFYYTLQTASACTSVVGGATTPEGAINSTVVLTAAATCGSGAAEYRYWMQAPGSTTWTSLSGFPTGDTFTWNTNGLTDGVYRIEVDARRSGSTGPVEAKDIFSYTLRGQQYCSSVSVSFTPEAGSVPAGTPVAINASANCPLGTAPEYRYWAQVLGGNWVLLRTWSSNASATFTGNSTSWYRIEVDVRVSGNSGVDAKSIPGYRYSGAGACGGTVCSGLCFDTNTDPQHCGSCTNACSVGQTCSGGTCGTP